MTEERDCGERGAGPCLPLIKARQHPPCSGPSSAAGPTSHGQRPPSLTPAHVPADTTLHPPSRHLSLTFVALTAPYGQRPSCSNSLAPALVSTDAGPHFPRSSSCIHDRSPSEADWVQKSDYRQSTARFSYAPPSPTIDDTIYTSGRCIIPYCSCLL